MNIPTETLAERLTAHNAWRRGENDEQPVNATLLGKTLDHAASRLLAQHETMMRQTECIAELEKELEEVRDYYTSALDSERMWRAKADRYWQELQAERALADRLAELVQRNRDGYGGQVVNPRCKCQDCEYLAPIDKALAAWKDARRA